MKFIAALTLAAAAIPQVLGHYRFLNFDGTGDYDYIRSWQNINSNGPVTTVSTSDIRCNLGAASTTSLGTKTVNAGDTAKFTAYQTITHPGPLLFYMAKAPSTVNGWDASGNVWFKIAQTGASISGGAITWPAQGSASVSVTIPKSLPSGEYLLRVESIALHSAGSSGGAQFYISCAQINVVNGGSGTPGPLVAFPGAYSATDPGIMINIYYPVPTSYTPPGPAVWSG